ncbi:carbohydrate ABC transporter permease [Roseiflexus sp.]|uniref:carbohydrate ABC transporter permease n=1 Tax=Roseiflexus sp. TaxID=2562120 RepID=UPI0021DCA15D|nr:carbohydrate ABC transporter permease [Roseiflexus sp.]GIV52950.1 MAG: sugar ABC transporter permease [Candidatus Kapabacteria bacterium]GIW01920.1 MAG: sugar ABC transporter permease [Roseiflexus sp.]
MSATASNQSVTMRRRMRLKTVRHFLVRLFLYLLVAGSGVLFLFPWVWLVSTSLKSPEQLVAIPPRLIPDPVMWINYYYGVTYVNFPRYMLNTLIIAASVVLARLVSCTVVAYALSHVDWPGRRVLFALVLATMMLPAQVTIIPLFIIYSHLGWVNTFLPLIVPSLFGDAFFVFLMRQFFVTIPRDLIDAARIDGASHFGIYLRIVMPLAGPALATLVAFSFIWTYNDFIGPLIYLKDRDLWTLSLGMQGFTQRYGTGGTALGAMMAAATLYTLPMILLFLAAQKTFIRGIVTTGLK